MAYDVEDKVVQMRFDNREFDPNIDASIKSLEKLEKSLQLANGTKGFEDVDKAAKKMDLNPAITAVETLKNGFSAMEVAAITAISNITNKVMALGSKIVNAFAIAPLTSGFSEYSQQMDSTQIILSNLSGETLESVTDALDVLNEYADRTIYSFGQMTQAIGKFAAAGVELKPATDAIQGLSSAAATVGANNQQLFSAYYNLAQAMQVGKMNLIDWKSLENSTIGNKTMREAFIKTAIQMGKFAENSREAADAYADFRGSLSKHSWLTTDVIVETLGKYSKQMKNFSKELGDAVDGLYMTDAKGNPIEPLIESVDSATGDIIYTLESTGEKFEKWEVDLATTAFKSATEIKSFKQMWDTLTEAAGTGWAETWKIIFGDLEQAKKLWTEVSKPIQNVIDTFNELRNSALKDWADMGGREDLIQTLINLARTFGSVAELVRRIIEKLFGTTTNKAGRNISNFSIALYKVTHVLQIFTEYLVLSEEEIEKTSDDLALILRPLKKVGQVLSIVARILLSVIVMGVALAKTIAGLLLNLAAIPAIIDEIFGAGAWDSILSLLEEVGNLLVLIFVGAVEAGGMFIQIVSGILGVLRTLIATIFDVDEESINFRTVLSFIGYAIAFVIEKAKALVTGITNIIRAIREFITTGNFDLSGIFGKNASTSANFFIDGIVGALTKGITKVKNTAVLVAKALVESFNGPDGIDCNSPSKKSIKAGNYYVEGLNESLTNGSKIVAKSAAKLGKDISKATSKALKDSKSKNSANKGILDTVNQNAANIAELHKVSNDIDKAEEKTEEQMTVIQRIGSVISNVWNTVKEVVKNLSLSKVLIITFAATIVALVIQITRVVGEFKEVLEGLGRILKATAARIWSEAFDQIGQALFNLAKSLALIVLIAHFDPQGLKQAVIILGVFIAVIATLVVVFSRLITVSDKLRSITKASEALRSFGSAIAKVVSLISIALLISSMSLSIMMLSEALHTLSEIDTPGLVKGIIALTVLLGIMTAVVVVLGKTSGGLISGAFVILAYGIALKIFSNALSQIQDIINPYIEKFTNMTTAQSVLLLALVVALTALSFAMSKAGVAVARVITSMAGLAIGIGVMAFIMGIFKNNDAFNNFISAITSVKFLVTLIVGIAVTIALFTASGIILMKAAKKAELTSDNLTTVLNEFSHILKSLLGGVADVIAAIVLMGVALSLMSKFVGADVAKSAFSRGAVLVIAISLLMGVLITGLTFLAKYITSNNIDPNIFDHFSKVLTSLAVSFAVITAMMTAITLSMMLFWDRYNGNTAKGWMVLGSVAAMIAITCGIISGMLAVIGRNFKNDSYKNLLAAMIPIIILVGELMTAMALFAFMKPKDLIPGIIAINAVMAPIIGLVTQMNKLTYVSSSINGGEKEYRTVGKLFDALLAVFISASVLIGEIAGISVLMSSNLVSVRGIVGSLIAFGLIMGLAISTIVLLGNQVQKILVITNSMQPDTIHEVSNVLSTLLVGIRDILIVVGTTLLAFGASVAGILAIYNTPGLDSGTVAKVMWFMEISLALINSLVITMMAMASELFDTVSKMNVKQMKLSAMEMKTVIGTMFNGIKDVLISVGSIIIAFGASIAGILAIAGKYGISADAIWPMLMSIGMTVTGAMAIIGAMVFGLLENAKKVSVAQIESVGTILADVKDILIVVGTIILAIGATMFGILKSGRTWWESVILIQSLGLFIAEIFGVLYLFMKKYNSNVGNINVAPIIVMLANISGIIALLGGVLSLLRGFNIIEFLVYINSLVGAVGILTLLMMAMTKMAKNSNNINPALLLVISISFHVLSTSIIILAGALLMLSTIPSEKINSVIGALFALIGALAAMAVMIGVLGAIAKALKQWSLIGLAIFVAMAAAILAFAGAVVMLSHAPLDNLVQFLEKLADNTINTGLKRLVGAVFALSAALTLGGPGWLILFAGLAAVLGVASIAFMSFAATLLTLSSAADSIAKLLVVLKGLQGVILPLAGVLAILTLFAPTLVIFSIALAVPIAVTALLVAAIAKLATSLDLINGALVPFVQELAACGKVISDNWKSFLALGLAIAGLGVALGIAGPGLITLAAAISMVVVAIGFALALASPLILAIGIAISLIIKAVTSAKDAFVDLFNAVIDRLPEIANILTSMAPMASEIAAISGALLVFGIALLAIGVGGVVAAISILALAGAIKVFMLVMNSLGASGSGEEVLNRLIELLTQLSNSKGDIAGLGGVLAVLGLGLIILGVGALTAAIGLTALGGALALLKFVAGSFETLIEAFQMLLTNKGNIAGLGGVLAVLALGLIVLGVGALIASIGLVALGGALALLTYVAGSFDTLVAAFEMLLNNKGNIAGLGGVLAVLGLGLAVLSVGLALVAIPLIVVAAAIAALIAVIMVIATLCMMVIVPLLTILVTQITAMFDAITNSTMAMQNFLITLVAISSSVSLTELGTGLLFVAAGFLALGAAGAIVGFLSPLILVAISIFYVFVNILYMASDAITYFGEALESAATSISKALLKISKSFETASSNIVKGVNNIKGVFGLGAEGGSAGTDFIGGFIGTIKGGVSKVFNACKDLGAEAVEGFRSKDGIDSHSWSKQMISAAKDFFGGFVGTIKEEGIGSIGKAAKNAGAAAVKNFVAGENGEAGKTDILGWLKNALGEDNALVKGAETVKSIMSGDFDMSSILEKLGLTDDVTKELGFDTDELADSYSNLGSSASGAKSTLESLTDTLKNQMKIFERFTADEEMIDPAELINNMESQLRGMQNWSSGLDILVQRGISGPLLQYLSEMGPEGYKYVEAFIAMTEDEFAYANELYSDSLDLPESTANDIIDNYKKLGVEIVEASNQASGGIKDNIDETADNIEDTTNETVDNISEAVINGVKFTKEELNKLVEEYGEEEELIYVKFKDGMEKVMTTTQYGEMITSSLGKAKADIETEVHIDTKEMKMTDEAIKAIEKYSDDAMLYYVESRNAFYDRAEWIKFCQSNQDAAAEGFSLTKDQVMDLINGYGSFVETAADESAKAIARNSSTIEDATADVGTATAISAEEAFQEEIDRWLDSDVSGIGLTVRKRLTDEFKELDLRDALAKGTTLEDYLYDKYKESHPGDEIYDAGNPWSREDISTRMRNMSDKQSEEIIVELTNGLKVNGRQYLSQCYSAGAVLGGEVLRGTKEALGIHSPSEEYEKVANFSVLGFTKGIFDNINKAEDASEELGDDTLNSLIETIRSISSTFNEEMDLEPTIRPILDLSNVYDGMNQLDTMFATNQARIAGNAFVKANPDDSINKLEQAYRRVAQEANMQLVNAIQQSDKEVIVNVTLQGSASDFFNAMVEQTKGAVKSGGRNPLLIVNNHSINASVLQ